MEVLIENGEELTLTVTYTLPKEGLPADVVCTPDVKLDYQGTTVNPPLLSVDETTKMPISPYKARLTDATKDSDATTAKAGDTVVYTWVLDSLENETDPASGERTFPKQFRGLISGRPGGEFTVTAKLKLTAPGYIESAYYAQDTDNSLFAEETGDGDTAYIANVRHLQNLHRDHSNAGDFITKAEQLCDVDCKGEAYNFIPIANGKLTSYNGRHNGRQMTISSLGGLYLVGGGAALPLLRRSIEHTVDLPLLDPADLLPEAGKQAAAGVFAAGAAMGGK